MCKPNKEKPDKGCDDVVQMTTGIWGKWQLWISFLLVVVKIPIMQHQTSILFQAPLSQEFYCIDNISGNNCASNCSKHVFDKSIFPITITSQWDLVCDQEYLQGLVQTIAMIGVLIGNIMFGICADRFGRRTPLVIALVIMSVFGIVNGFITSLPWFLVTRFLLSVGNGGTMILSFCLLMECIAIKWRTTVCIIYQLPFFIGHLILPGISYFIRDWRHFQLAISIPAVLLISYQWLLPESPRWLITMENREGAVEVLTKAAKSNKLPTERIPGLVDQKIAKIRETRDKIKKFTILDLFKTHNIRKQTFIMSYNWFVVGAAFFGVAQYTTALGGDIFVNVTLSASLEVPSVFFSLWCAKAWGRKLSLIFAFLMCSLPMFCIAFVPDSPIWIKPMLAMIVMFGASLSFIMVYIYTAELYPTVLRSMGCGFCSTFTRISGMLAPHISLMRSISPILPPIYFGSVPLIGLVLTLFLPETLDCTLPESIEDAEIFAETYKKRRNGTESNLDRQVY